MQHLSDGELAMQINGAGLKIDLASIRAARKQVSLKAIQAKHKGRFSFAEYQPGDFGLITLDEVKARNPMLEECLKAGGRIGVVKEDGNARILLWHDPDKSGYHPLPPAELAAKGEQMRQAREDEAVNAELMTEVLKKL
jgi:hypothetical protein